MLGEHRYYIQDRSQLMNIFDFDSSLSDSHFNALRILKYLITKSNTKTKIGHGYVLIDNILKEAERVMITNIVIKDTLVRLSSYNLVEYDNQSKNDIEHAAYVKITPAGNYILKI